MKLTSDSLATHLGERLLPAYLVSGDEPLLAAEAADAVRARARGAGFTQREVHFIERAADWDEVRASAANLSLFAARRVMEIRLASGRPGTAGNAALIALLEARDPDTLFLILTPRLDRDAQGADWVRSVEAHGAWVQIWPVDSHRLVAWLKGRCRRLKLDASDEALELLAARTEGNLLAAHQELTQLALLAPEGKVTPDTVLAGVADSARFDVFGLGEAVLKGEAARALRVLTGLRAEGTEPTLVLWALSRALRDVWSARGGDRPPASQQRHRAALEQALRRASRLPFAALARRAARVDRTIKGRVVGDAWDQLALLAADICGQPPASGLRRARAM
ncbi:MAG: DNA polymerase III subunit delta [Gammaproteobacteria bacterium]|nr:MAG: DNA polymerase III subunit delta [Gammaproteobacteria bacterium]TLZ05827.1 MAG: DNA polymerase III subunit delta [Gammaproteobacteria bacterium]TLZ42566.1 MAG: DNA polymerase III subunit delta [Gammaproteobacteria bacterium]